jgi:hypothetical protein
MASTMRSHLHIEQVEIGKLIPWERNPRVNERAVNPVAKSIKQFGFNVSILCNKDFHELACLARKTQRNVQIGYCSVL